jgi:hypothetical protein
MTELGTMAGTGIEGTAVEFVSAESHCAGSDGLVLVLGGSSMDQQSVRNRPEDFSSSTIDRADSSSLPPNVIATFTKTSVTEIQISILPQA